MPTIHAFGPEAWLVDDLTDPAAWAAGLEEIDVEGVEEVVPAEASVLVVTRRDRAEEVGHRLTEVRPRPRRTGDVPIEISVTYDGDDLGAVAESIGGTVDEVVRLHSETEYRVAFCGFSPGFAYLSGLPERLHLPRRDSPRVRVPAGSVAIAAHYSAIYPSPSPGGWHLLGRTDEVVWDVHRHPPTRLRPGTGVRFVVNR